MIVLRDFTDNSGGIVLETLSALDGGLFTAIKKRVTAVKTGGHKGVNERFCSISIQVLADL